MIRYEYLKGGEYLSNMFFKFLANRPTYTNYIGRGVDKPDFALSAIGDTEGNPVATWAFRMSCQKCMNTSQVKYYIRSYLAKDYIIAKCPYVPFEEFKCMK